MIGSTSVATQDSDVRLRGPRILTIGKITCHLPTKNLVDKRRSRVPIQSHASDFRLRSIVTLAFPPCYCQRTIILATYRIMSRESKRGSLSHRICCLPTRCSKVDTSNIGSSIHKCQSRPFAYIARLLRSLRNPDTKYCRNSDRICLHRIAVEECGHANETLL